MYDIDRKTASRLLKVSLRTIDRYIVRKKLSSEHRDGRVFLDKKEIIQLRKRQKIDTSDTLMTRDMSIDNIDVIPIDTTIDNDETVYSHPIQKISIEKQKEQEDVYKKLFEQLQEELKEKQERLEGANYRVGQLESLLKETVPLLDHNRALSLEKAEKEQLKHSLDEKQYENEELISTLKEEKLNKKIYLIILFILLLLQPLWFIFPAKG